MLKSLSYAACLCLLAQPLYAADAEWTGAGELGVTFTSGNSKTSNVIAGLQLSYELEKWKHLIGLEALRSESDDNLTAERYVFEGQSNYKLSERSYLLGALRYEDDSFSGYDSQTSVAFGYGRSLIQNERTTLDVEGGIGYRRSELISPDETQSEAIFRGALNYSRKIGENSVFTQSFLVEAGSDNVHSESDTGFSVAISDAFALKVSLLVKNNSDVPVGTKKTDTITAVTLVYGF